MRVLAELDEARTACIWLMSACRYLHVKKGGEHPQALSGYAGPGRPRLTAPGHPSGSFTVARLTVCSSDPSRLAPFVSTFGPEALLASGFHGWGVLGTVKVLLAWENRAV